MNESERLPERFEDLEPLERRERFGVEAGELRGKDLLRLGNIGERQRGEPLLAACAVGELQRLELTLRRNRPSVHGDASPKLFQATVSCCRPRRLAPTLRSPQHASFAWLLISPGAGFALRKKACTGRGRKGLIAAFGRTIADSRSRGV
ncbi:MAG: hypothetical protein HYY79_04130 [Betaproteobacteria bacterium]|nr:hypothetical protein [Betaproteobacteria bacterium]